MQELPVGEPVTLAEPAAMPERRLFAGQRVHLRPLQPETDAAELYAASHGSVDKEAVWTYLFTSPFNNLEHMREWLESVKSLPEQIFLTVYDTELRQCVGMVSFMNIVPAHRRLELGSIWYAPAVQRTHVNTESIYLMLGHAFDDLRYRRVEWKCDALNARSRAAALRLGFKFEGIFRQHMIIKGRNRDTAWYAMMDHEWPAIKANMEQWLYDNPGGRLSLSKLNGVSHGP